MSSDPESGRGREERPEMAHEERSPGSSGSSGETMPPTDEGGADEYETFADASDGGDLERELAEALGGMNLDSLIDLDIPRGGSAATAEAAEGVRHGTVIDVQGDDIFVDMGGKSQGIIAAEQFSDEGIPEPGDEIEVTIEGYDRDEGLLILSRKGAVMAATWRDVEEGQIVEGRVKGHNKGGLELDVDGIKAFMPISQIELFRVEELAPYVNRRLSCQIMEVRRDEKTLVVSRRDLLRREEEAQRQRTFETLVEGQTVRGVVKTIMPYGAFVDIGGIDGLVHIRDLAHRRVEDPKEIVKEGQQIEVMVLKIDREERKIGLGLKQVMPDPWESAGAKWPVDTVISVRVVKLMDFGAFAELEPGVEGLIPVSEMSYGRRISHPKEVVGEGDVVKVRVINLDAESRKIGLSLKQVGDDPWMGASVRWPVDGVVEGKVTRLAEFGAFVELAPGVEGLIHISELSDGHVRSASEVVREGQAVEAMVLEVDEERRRIGLSLKALKLDPNYTGEASGTAEAPRSPKKRKKPLKGGLDW